MSNDKIVTANRVDVCVETFGEPADPPILLIQGMGGSMLWWEDEFCERLAAGGRFVIRYDNRDTGRSVTYPPGAPTYTGADLAEDAVGLLDTLGLPKAHVVGISMGAGIAQHVAVHHPDRVATLTLISFSPGPGDPDLPPTSEEVIAGFARAEPDWTDPAAVIDYLVADSRVYAAASQPFDEAAVRDLVTRDVDRAVNIASIVNHGILVSGADDSASDMRKRLGELTVKTLVLHGTEDPLFPIGHGLALANEIPNAHLVTMERTGHELPERVWDAVIPAIVAHTGETS